MKNKLHTLCVAASLAVLGSAAIAKLPAPSEEAKAKSAEAAAKTAWAGKVDAYKLCLAQDKVVAHVKKAPVAKAPTQAASSAAAAGACVDPGPFVAATLVPNGAVAPVAPAVAATTSVAKQKKP